MQDKTDWGINQGFTQLFWAVVVILYCFFLIIYPIQTLIRGRVLTRAHKILLISGFFFLVLGLVLFSWISHDPNLSFYHNFLGLFPEGTQDKVMHVIGSFILTLALLSIAPKRSTVILIPLLFGTFEIFEVLVISFLEKTPLAVDASTTLLKEIVDIPYDMIANFLGWGAALVIMRNKIRR